MQDELLKPRALERTRQFIPPILWELYGPTIDAAVLERCTAAGLNWALLPGRLDIETLKRVGSALAARAWHFVLGAPVEELLPRKATPLLERLAALQCETCEAILLQSPSTGQLKAGTPLHRLSQLRDAGRLRSYFLDAEDIATAEWMVEHTPAHAVAIPYGLADQTARYRLIDAATELGTALLARRPPAAAWNLPREISLEEDLVFRLGPPGISAAIEPLPCDATQLDQLLVSRPMSPAQREQWWAEFQRQVPPPARPRAGHVPEEGM